MPYGGSWRRQHSRVLVFMFTDFTFIHQPGVMITDFKMLLLPVLFTFSDRAGKKDYPQLMLIQAFGKLVNSCSFFLLIILLLLSLSTSFPLPTPIQSSWRWCGRGRLKSAQKMSWMLDKEVWPSVCVYWNLVEPWSELCCSRNPLEFQRHMGKNHCDLKKQSRQASWVHCSRWILNKHRVMILERR